MYFRLERVQRYCRELAQRIYAYKCDIENIVYKEGYFTDGTAVSFSAEPWHFFMSGDYWGGNDKYYWFRFSVPKPITFIEGQLAVTISTDIEDEYTLINPQMLVYVNGEVRQGVDINHREIILREKDWADGEPQIDIRAHSGMYDRKVTLKVHLVKIHSLTRETYYNMRVPLEVAEQLPDGDQRKALILSALNEVINMIDLRTDYSEAYNRSFVAANDYLDSHLYTTEGWGTAKASIIGHTHIDVAWLWTLSQTREKVARSFSTVLDLMDRYPDYKFMSSQPQLYKYLKEDHPDLFHKIKARVKEGRWEAEGAMWVEADCNVTSGESLVRQILMGKRFFKEEFGVDNEILWLPDVFGYSAALPQILQRSGIKYFMTTKISWSQFNKMPYDTMNWVGIDGSQVLTHFITTKDLTQTLNPHFTTYNGFLYPEAVMGGWNRYQQKEINDDILIAYGYGDGGGGPTMEMLENHVRMEKGIPGCPVTKSSFAGTYFHELAKLVEDHKHLPSWVGELYLEYHRGTYTSMARNKRDNRKSELLYRDLEFMSVWCQIDQKQVYPMDRIRDGWEIILRNQFHDILPGSSIKEVYDDSDREYKEALGMGKELLEDRLGGLFSRIDNEKTSLVMLNTLSHRRSDNVHFELNSDNVNLDEGQNLVLVSDEGREFPCQKTVDSPTAYCAYVEDIPSMGYITMAITTKAVDDEVLTSDMNALSYENPYYAVELDDKGTFLSIYDKENQRQVLKEGTRGNRLVAYEDKPMGNDNWDIDIYYKEKSWEIDQVQSMKWVEKGPVRSVLEVVKTFMSSTVTQRYIFGEHQARIDIETEIDWKEKDILLKAVFPVEVHSNKGTYDIQFGNVERPTHWNTSWDVARFEVVAHKWMDLSEGDFGVSIMNDSKYGCDIKDQTMSLTLLTSGTAPNPDADKEYHRFSYAIMPHKGDWKQGKTHQMANQLNSRILARVIGEQSGDGLREVFMFTLDKDNVVIEAVKRAEDDHGIIIRLFEYQNSRTKVVLTSGKPFGSVLECNLMEEEEEKLADSGCKVELTLKPYEIKTLKITY